MRQSITIGTLSLLLVVLGSSLASIATATPSAKIIGGSVAIDAPWMAGLHYYDPDTNQYSTPPFCGASLIAPGWVVTAAHCVDGGLTADNLLVRVDRPDLGTSGAPIQPQHVVRTLTTHPSYLDALDGFDITLLQLETASSATPVSIADQTLMDQLNISANTTNAVDILGWGVYDGDGVDFDPDQAASGPRPRLLQQATLDFLPLSNYRGEPIPADVVLAHKRFSSLSSPNGVDSCFGDSGGPLLVPADRTIGTLTRSISQLVGITSFGNNKCNSAIEPGGYTRVASYTDWIEQTTDAAGDALSDLRVQIDNNYHDILPGSTTESFSVTVFNDSIHNSVGSFTVQLRSDGNDTDLEPHTSLSTSCSGATELKCTSTQPLAAGQSVVYYFSVTDRNNAVRSAFVNAEITAQKKDDYRLVNNSDTFAIHYTDGPDVGVSIENVSTLYGKFDIVVRNESDLFSANNLAVTLTSNIALEWTDTDECIASSDFSVICTTATLAPLAEVNRTINLPANTSLSLIYNIDVSVTHDGPDNNSANDSDSATIVVRPSNQRPSSFLASSRSSSGGSAAWLTFLLAALLASAGLSRLRASRRT